MRCRAAAGTEIARPRAVTRPPLIYPRRYHKMTAADRLSAADLSLIGPHLEN